MAYDRDVISELEAENMQFVFDHLHELNEEDRTFVLSCLMLAHQAKRNRQQLLLVSGILRQLYETEAK